MNFRSLIKRVVNKTKFLARYSTSFQRRLPDFIIIGVQKGGTTSLYHYLKAHPRIRLSLFKETHYFNENFEKGEQWYRAFFPFRWNKKLKVGEATPCYLFYPEVPGRIKSILPDIKLIVLLRHPVDRALSQYKMNVKRGDDSAKSFEEAIGIKNPEAPPIRKQKNRRKYYSYLERGLYGKQIQNWFNYFPREQFLFLKSEDLFENPSGELDKVFEFLGLEKHYPDSFEAKNAGVYSPVMLDKKTMDYLSEYYKEDEMKLKEVVGYRYL